MSRISTVPSHTSSCLRNVSEQVPASFFSIFWLPWKNMSEKQRRRAWDQSPRSLSFCLSMFLSNSMVAKDNNLVIGEKVKSSLKIKNRCRFVPYHATHNLHLLEFSILSNIIEKGHRRESAAPRSKWQPACWKGLGSSGYTHVHTFRFSNTLYLQKNDMNIDAPVTGWRMHFHVFCRLATWAKWSTQRPLLFFQNFL